MRARSSSALQSLPAAGTILMFLQAAQAAVQPRPKFSPALLNMRHIERTLAFQKEFSKADKVCHALPTIMQLW
jgi:hypothetical protein